MKIDIRDGFLRHILNPKYLEEWGVIMKNKWIPVEIMEINPYTMEDEKIVDQIVVVKLSDGVVLRLFDAECKVNQDAIKKHVLLSIELLIYKIKKEVDSCSFNIRQVNGWLVDVCGKYLKVAGSYSFETPYGLITTYQKYDEYFGKKIVAYGRLDVNDVKI